MLFQWMMKLLLSWLLDNVLNVFLILSQSHVSIVDVGILNISVKIAKKFSSCSNKRC